MSDPVFEDYGAYYDLLYRDKDYAAEAAYIGRIIKRTAPAAASVLEFGSGTGKHGRLLADQGYEVTGVERSPTMARIAQEAPAVSRGSFRCVEGDIRTVKLERAFDAVLSVFHVVSYQIGNADLLQTFANAARHLKTRGVFLFDVWHGPAVLSQRPSIRVKRVENKSLRLTRIAEPEMNTETGTVAVRYTIFAEARQGSVWKTFSEEHEMRYLFPTEIELLAEQTEFEVEAQEEFLTGAPPSENTWGVAYLLRKR